MAKLQEIKKPLTTILTFNVIDGPTEKQLNKEPMTMEEAQAFTRQIHESDSGAALVIRSNRAVLQE